jgi:hypothetical protein
MAGESFTFANSENATGGTDIIIVPNSNSTFTNMHTLIQENFDECRSALQTVWQFVQHIAAYMAEDATFWLEIHVGEARQNGMKHFVVHFKSDTPVVLGHGAKSKRLYTKLGSPKIEMNYTGVCSLASWDETKHLIIEEIVRSNEQQNHNESTVQSATLFTPKAIGISVGIVALAAAAAYCCYSWWTKK